MTMQLGTFGAWFSPVYDDAARTAFVVEAEALGYTTAWLGLGARAMADLSLVERVLDATTTIVVATAIVNMWTNDAVLVARSYRRIAAKHPDRFLLGVGVSHPETIATYRSPLDTMATYLDTLEAGGVPQDRRVLAALGPRALQLAGARAAGTHPNPSGPDSRRTSTPAPTTSASRSSSHPARIPCLATGRSPASSTDAGHRGRARISRTWRALGGKPTPSLPGLPAL